MKPNLLSVADACALVLADASPLSEEAVPLAEACGRILTRDVAALRTQPPADLSAMDGYAVRAADIAATPATLALIGEVAAGHPFHGAVAAGQAARIYTGGVVPPGADTIAIQENVRRDGDRVTVLQSEPPGRHIRKAGLDFSEGQVLLAKGRRLTDRDVMLAAALNHPVLAVHRAPHVAILATGDELVPPGAAPGPGEIVYSNGFALAALAHNNGARVTDLGIAPDRIDETAAAIRKAREAHADVLVTTGGASVGEYDLVQKALASEGLDLSFWKVALRPGRPLMHGRLGGMQVLGLPGNPVSAYVCALLFLVPLLRRLSGEREVAPRIEAAVLGRDLPKNDERADYMRATLTRAAAGEPVATPFPAQDSSMMATLANADCLVVREPNEPAAKAGDRCSILKLTPAF